MGYLTPTIRTLSRFTGFVREGVSFCIEKFVHQPFRGVGEVIALK